MWMGHGLCHSTWASHSRPGVHTGSGGRAVCEDYLGTQLIARVSKARSGIAAAMSADYPLKAHASSWLALPVA